MLNRKKAPKISLNFDFSLSKPETCKLSNGINLFFFNNYNLDIIHIIIRVNAGAIFEPQKQTSSAVYSLLNESCKSKSNAEFADFLNFYGSDLDISVTQEFVFINIIIPKKNCFTVIPVVFDAIINPEYREDSLCRFKNTQICRLKYNLQKSDYCANRLINSVLVNPEIPAGNLLTEKDIENLSIAKLHNYHSSTFNAENIGVFIAGNILDNDKKMLKTILSKIKIGTPTIYPDLFPPNFSPEKLIFQERKNSLQSSIRICRQFIDYKNYDKRAFSVLNCILGGYFGSRLMKNIREEKGYSYGIHSKVNFFGNVSIFYISAEVQADATNIVIRECEKEINNLKNIKIEKKELEEVKNYMRGIFLQSLDGTVDYMRQYMIWQSVGYDEQEYKTLNKIIDNITPEDINKLANKYFNLDLFTTIIVGKM